MYYVYCALIITWIAVKLLCSWIYLYHRPTDLHYLWPCISANELSASRRCCWSGRAQGVPGNAVHKTKLRSQTLIYQTLYARWNENNTQHFLKTDFHSKYSDIRTPALGFDFETCSAQPSVLPTSEPFKFQGFKMCDVSGVDFEMFNFVDCFMPKHTRGLIFKKWKSIIRPL